MRGRALVLVSLLAPAAALAGCLEGAAPEGDAAEAATDAAVPSDGTLPEAVLVVDDPVGDARLYNADYVKALSNACGATGVRGGPSCRAVRTALLDRTPGGPESVATGGVPAPPTLDVLAVRFRETPTELVVEADVGEVAPDFSHVADGDLVETTVCWTTSERQCEERVYVWAERTSRNAHTEVGYRVNHPTCNVRLLCSYGIAVEIDGGSPGTIRWHIPRMLMPNATAGDTLRGAYAYSWTVERDPDNRVRWSGATSAGSESGSQSGNVGYFTDLTENGTAFPFTTPLARMDLSPLGDGLIVDAEDDLRNGLDRPDMDILSTRIVENETHLGVAVEVAEVATEATAGPETLLVFGLDLRMSTGANVIAGENRRNDRVFQYARRCGDATCAKAGDIQATFERRAGSPGTITVTFPRSDLGSPPRGTIVNNFNAYFVLWDGVRNPVDDDGTGGYAERYVGEDFTPEIPPYVLRYGQARSGVADDGRVALSDAVGDVAFIVPEGVPRPRFDVSFVEVVPTGPATTRILLGIMNLDQTAPPPPYDAVIYAVGLETADGAFVVAYSHDTQGTQKFFCAQDSLVFTPTRRDPLEGVAKDIEGAIALGQATDSDSEVGGGRSGASIAFDVPHECFARSRSGSFEALRMAGATFGLQNPTGRSGSGIVDRPFDEAVLDSPFLVQFVSPPAPPEPWYVAPFGISNFWDITGVLAAVAISGGGLLAIERRRTRLRRWLARVDDALASTKEDARARESSLVGLRARLHEDLVRGRMSEGHYAIVERRIDEELAKARVASIGEAFRELPYWLVTKLQGLLADGVMTKDDVRVFSAAVAETALPDATKAELRARLEAWAGQDRAASERADVTPP